MQEQEVPGAGRAELDPVGRALLLALPAPVAVFAADLRLVGANAAWEAGLAIDTIDTIDTPRQTALAELIAATLADRPAAPLGWRDADAHDGAGWELSAQVFSIAQERCVLVQAHRVKPVPAVPLQAILETAVAGVCITDEEGRYVLVNRAYGEIYGYRSEELLGKNFLIVIPAERRDYIWKYYQRFFKLRIPEVRGAESQIERSDGSKVDVRVNMSLMTQPNGQRFQIVSVNDITLPKAQAKELLRRAELAEAETAKKSQLLAELDQKLAIIEQQHDEIVALSAPLLDVWHRIIALPLIGRFDRTRAATVSELLLAAVVARRVQYVLLDLTSCEFVDSNHGSLIAQLVQAVQLLGARCVLTGISPAVAQSLVTLDLDLSRLRIAKSLQEALRTCIPEVEKSRRV